jgi:uncharacterized protein involved in type VI secretion and phage assembly
MTTTRPRSTHSHDQRFFGAYIGLVKGVDKNSKEGGVILTFPWFDDDRTEFAARVSTLYSGPDYGTVWTPEKGGEVVVMFECGDLREPIIVGCLHNGVDKPPTVRSDNEDHKMFRTKAGHQLVFRDGPTERGIEALSADGHSVRIDDRKGEIEVSINGGPVLTMTRTDIKMKATNITIDATANVKIVGARIELN